MGSSRIKGITIEIDGNTTNLQKSLSKVNSRLSSTQSALKDVNKLLKLDPGNVTLLKQKQDLLMNSINATRTKLDQEKEALAQLQASDTSGETKEQQAALEREIADTTQQLQKLEDEYKEFGSVSSQQLQVAGQKMQEVGENISNVGNKLMPVTAAIAAVGAASGAAWKEVDDAQDTVIEKTGATGEALEDLTEQMEDVATTIPTDFDTAATAVGEVNTRFHLTGDELETLSEKFIKFSDINGTDVNSSIDAVQKAMAAFGVDTAQAGDVLDLLNTVGQNTGVSLDTLESSLTTNAAALSEMGYNISDAATFLGELEVSGADSSAVLTGLKKALTNASAEGKTMDEALAEVQDSMLNASSETEGLNAAIDLFGSKAGPAIYEACKNGTLSFEDLGTSLEDTAGSVDDTYAAVTDPVDTLQTALNQLKIIGADLANTFLDMVAPAIEALKEKVSELKEKWDGLSEGQQQMIIKAALVVAAIAPALVAAGKVVSTIGTITTLMGKVQPALTAAKAAIAGISAPMVAVAAVAAVLVAAFATLWATNEEFRNSILGTWNEIASTVQNFAQQITDRINALGFDFQNIGEVIKAAWMAVCDFLAPIFEEVWANIGVIISTALDVILGVWDTFSALFNGDWEGVWSGIQEIVSSIFSGISELISNQLNTILGYFGTDLNSVLSTVRSVFNSVKSTISSVFGAAKSVIFNILGAIKSKFSSIFETVKSTVSNAIASIKNMFNFTWSLPHISLPHFSISPAGWVIGDLLKGTIPSLSISWYKEGGILDGAQIFGSMGGTMLGGGEAGKEAVLPLSSFYKELDNIIGARIGGNVEGYLKTIAANSTRPIYMDGDLVSEKVDRRLGKKYAAYTR